MSLLAASDLRWDAMEETFGEESQGGRTVEGIGGTQRMDQAPLQQRGQDRERHDQRRQRQRPRRPRLLSQIVSFSGC